MFTDPFAPNLVFTDEWLHWHLSAIFCPRRSWLCSEPGSLVVPEPRSFPAETCSKDVAEFFKMVGNTCNHILLELQGLEIPSSHTHSVYK